MAIISIIHIYIPVSEWLNYSGPPSSIVNHPFFMQKNTICDAQSHGVPPLQAGSPTLPLRTSTRGALSMLVFYHHGKQMSTLWLCQNSY